MGDELQDHDPYGSKGEQPLPSWSERWVHMSQRDLAHYWGEVATWSLLNVTQMEYVIQGLPPPNGAWQAPACILEGSVAGVHRLRHDIAQGHFPPSASPAELVAWCDHYGVDVPAAFVAVTRQGKNHRSDHQPQSTKTYVGPSWAPLPMATASAPAKKPVRGRPKSTTGRNERLVQAANATLMERAGQGRALTICKVAAALFGTPVAEGMKRSNIERQLKGKLNLDQARSLATRAEKTRGEKTTNKI